MFVGSGSLFSILLLCRIMDIAYCVAITLISSNVCLMLILGILNIISILFLEEVCVATTTSCEKKKKMKIWNQKKNHVHVHLGSAT